MNILTKILPWRVQTFLGYRPNGVIDAAKFQQLKNIKITKRHYDVNITSVPLPVNVEEKLPQPFYEVDIERVSKHCSDFFCAETGKASLIDIDYLITIIKDHKVLQPLSIDPDTKKLHRGLSLYEYPEKVV